MKAITEKDVARLWQTGVTNRAGLITEDGEPLQVIYPGRINDDKGADFRDAVIGTGHGLVKGEVEVHVRSSNWVEHGHNHDPAYNRVVLHVVMWHDREVTISLENGRAVPVLSLGRYVQTLSPDIPNGLPCHNAQARMGVDAVGRILDEAGEERFRRRASRWGADLTSLDPNECLYRGIMEALGYTRNRTPFAELARRLPLTILSSASGEGLICCQSILLGAAGLLPSQRPEKCAGWEPDDEWVRKLEGFWTSSGLEQTMPARAWNLYKVRPGNSPVRRLAAMSHILFRHRETSILDSLVSLAKEDNPALARHGLEGALTVMDGGYWANHYDFGSPLAQSPTLLGCSRAGGIVVDVFLPFLFAWGQFTAQSDLADRGILLYKSCPRLAENTVERNMMRQLGLTRQVVDSARRQQGLLHIYKTLCTEGGCGTCPLG